jgi:gas vesicle protein
MGKGATVMSEYERQNRELAYEPKAQEVGSDFGAGREKTPEEIELEIQHTRNRLSRDIDDLGNKLNPHNLKEEAKSAIKGAAQGAVSNVSEQARRTGSRLVEVIRENPLPVIAVGAGVTWLLTQRSRSDISGNRMARYAYTGPERRQGESWQSGSSGIRARVGGTVSEVKDSVSEAASSVAERAGEFKERAGDRIGELGGEARRQTRRLKTNLEHAADENPLALAIGAAVVGLALGMLLPGSQRENELMGSTRDQLVDRAERTAERVKEAAVEAGRELKDTVKAEIEEHKPEVKQAVQEAGQTVKEQVKESAKKVKNQAKDAAKEAAREPGRNPRSTA